MKLVAGTPQQEATYLRKLQRMWKLMLKIVIHQPTIWQALQILQEVQVAPAGIVIIILIK